MKRLMALWMILMLCHAYALGEERAKKAWHTSDYFSTVSGLFLYVDDAQARLFNETTSGISEIMASVENAVSLSVEDSDISKFNRLECGEVCAISNVTVEIIQTARSVYEESNGLYDPTVFPLVDLWSFSPRFHRNVYRPTAPYDRSFVNGMLPLPDTEDIEALLPLVDFSGVELFRDGEQWYLKKNIPPVLVKGVTVEAQMDLGGIAKGYVCDVVKNYLIFQGYDMGYFACGDSSIAALAYPSEEEMLTLSLGKPRAGMDAGKSGFATVHIRDTTVSTSSDSRHAFSRDGIRYCHLIDPRTGWPINMPDGEAIQKGIASVTVIGKNAAWSDAMTTALCVMGADALLEYLETPRDYDIISVFYTSDQNTYEVVTNMPTDRMVLDDPAYQLCSMAQGEGGCSYIGSMFSR